MSVVDLHQHLWPVGLLRALRERATAPRMVGWRLETAGEPDYAVEPRDHDAAARAEQDRADGVGLTLDSLSSPLGLEYLPLEDAVPILAAWNATEPGPARGLWAAAHAVEPDLADLAGVLVRPGVAGLQVPATALTTPGALERLAPTLATVEAAGLLVLVHPGPAGGPDGASPRPGEPPLPIWWPALTSYVAQLQSAWFAWHVAGRALLPTLRIAFVGLAGLAPLHHERLVQRGGHFGAVDPGVFYEISGYGPQAVDAVARVVGVDQLVNGSDRPYARAADPRLGEAFTHALTVTNPQRLLHQSRTEHP